MSDQPAEIPPGTDPGAGDPAAPAGITGRGILLALGFAAFAAYVAADFATGGRLTTWALAALAALRGRESTAGGDGG